jgi:hypothetical protein
MKNTIDTLALNTLNTLKTARGILHRTLPTALVATLALGTSSCAYLDLVARANPGVLDAQAETREPQAETVASAGTPQPARAPKQTTPDIPEADLTPPQGLPDLRDSIGTRHDGGWAPKVFEGLVLNMPPAEVAARFPGADAFDKFGFSRVKVKDVAGVSAYRFYYRKGAQGERAGLGSATIEYASSLNHKAPFFAYLATATQNKFGAVKPEALDARILTWVDSSMAMVQVSKISVYEVSYTPPRG